MSLSQGPQADLQDIYAEQELLLNAPVGAPDWLFQKYLAKVTALQVGFLQYIHMTSCHDCMC